MKKILETERLYLREFTLEDTDFILELINSPEWIDMIGDRKVKTPKDARQYLEKGAILSYAVNGFGISMVVIKDTDIPIGTCGIIRRTNLEHCDIGFAFLRQFTGQGYAFEIADAVMKYAREVLLIEKIVAITIQRNTRSIHLLKKIGMHYKKNFRMEGDDEELMLFSN